MSRCKNKIKQNKEQFNLSTNGHVLSPVKGRKRIIKNDPVYNGTISVSDLYDYLYYIFIDRHKQYKND